MKALIIKDKLNQDMVNSIKLWLGKDKLITNSMELVKCQCYSARRKKE